MMQDPMLASHTVGETSLRLSLGIPKLLAHKTSYEWAPEPFSLVALGAAVSLFTTASGERIALS